MPLYEYECKDCGVFEEIGKVGETVKPCPKCGIDSAKIISMFAFTKGVTAEMRRRQDTAKRHGEMKNDLKDKHGVHAYKPLPNSENRGFDQVYKDIKKLGSKVKDEIQATRAKNQIMTRLKQKQWMEGALKRTNKKREEMLKRKAAEKPAQK